MNKTLTTAAVAVVTSTLLVTGCSSSQSLDEACDSADNALQVVSTSLRGIMKTAPKTPERASKALTDLGTTFSEQTDDVTQTDVSDALSDIRSAMDDYAEQIGDYAQGDDEKPSDELLASSKNLTDSLNALDGVCS